MLLASVLLVTTTAIIALNSTIMIENALAQMYEDEYYDDNYYKYDNRKGYDNGYGYDNRYLEKDKKQEIFLLTKYQNLEIDGGNGHLE